MTNAEFILWMLGLVIVLAIIFSLIDIKWGDAKNTLLVWKEKKDER